MRHNTEAGHPFTDEPVTRSNAVGRDDILRTTSTLHDEHSNDTSTKLLRQWIYRSYGGAQHLSRCATPQITTEKLKCTRALMQVHTILEQKPSARNTSAENLIATHTHREKIVSQQYLIERMCDVGHTLRMCNEYAHCECETTMHTNSCVTKST
eukprot:Blabericola_migrator_1__5655@NODE_2872_length_2261_cov_76_532361_g1801_i0_p2_GENE_NODE_2872_length_2261_cov_76_532361_g1801_i0NODE_2872_length_2261_cov_76_532361_g1801_i0_p2_ORF_typecomplete_len154_score15_47_NODE_2872_length_2261_cov_76_532361_g1801_i016272088